MTNFERPSPQEVDKLERYRDYIEGFCSTLGVAEYIEAIREPAVGALDIMGTAAKLGITANFSDELIPHATIKGLDDGLPYIEILISTKGSEPAMSFAHEVGHYLLYVRGYHQTLSYATKERFCEYFGRQMSMPNVDGLTLEALDSEVLTRLCAENQVGIQSLFYWLMERRMLPDKIIVDSHYPELPNRAYSRKIKRSILCLSCEYGICDGRRVDSPEDFIPILDCTSSEFGQQFTPVHNGHLSHSDPEFEKLQRRYGGR